MNVKNTQGFTLIELMIVVAIIAILAAIAVTQYQDYIARSQFAEGPTIADGIKSSVSEYANQVSACPLNTTTGFVAPTSYAGKYVASATLGGTFPNCSIEIAFNPTGVANPLQSKTATFTGTDHGGTIEWVCTAAGILPRYLPQACR